MPVATFDTQKFSKALREAGVPEKQADAEATVLSEVSSLNFREIVTKDDLKAELKATKDELKSEMTLLEQRMRADLNQLAAKQTSDFTLVKWMLGALVTICSGIGIRLLLFPAK